MMHDQSFFLIPHGHLLLTSTLALATMYQRTLEPSTESANLERRMRDRVDGARLHDVVTWRTRVGRGAPATVA